MPRGIQRQEKVKVECVPGKVLVYAQFCRISTASTIPNSCFELEDVDDWAELTTPISTTFTLPSYESD